MSQLCDARGRSCNSGCVKKPKCKAIVRYPDEIVCPDYAPVPEKDKVVEPRKCDCSRQQLLAFGCKCGGV